MQPFDFSADSHTLDAKRVQNMNAPLHISACHYLDLLPLFLCIDLVAGLDSRTEKNIKNVNKKL